MYRKVGRVIDSLRQLVSIGSNWTVDNLLGSWSSSSVSNYSFGQRDFRLHTIGRVWALGIKPLKYWAIGQVISITYFAAVFPIQDTHFTTSDSP